MNKGTTALDWLRPGRRWGLGTIVLVALVSCTPAKETETLIPAPDTAPELAPETPSEGAELAEINIGGAGTPYPAMQLLAAAYEQRHEQGTGNVSIDFLPQNQTGGGIAGVKAGVLQLGTATRSPDPEEQFEGLNYRIFARDALGVAIHPGVEGVDNLTTAQLRAIYSGEETNWKAFGGPDAEIVVLDRPEDESAKRLLRDYYLGPDLVITPTAISLRQESEVLEAVPTTPYSIGPVSFAAAEMNQVDVTFLRLDGVAPGADAVRSGQYPMTRSLGLVWHQPPSAATQEFLDFVFSEEAEEVLAPAGFVPEVVAASERGS